MNTTVFFESILTGLGCNEIDAPISCPGPKF
jgi:hypothetical protein